MSNQKLIIGYYRLSMEDDSEGESNSIINQRKLVKDYISNIPELASMPFQEFYDDGYSGSSMERPAIKQVLELARENKVQCIVVKDFSRFARNYIEMGTYLEQIFHSWEYDSFLSQTDMILKIIKERVQTSKYSLKD